MTDLDMRDVKKRAMRAMDDAWLRDPSNFIRDSWGRIFEAAAPIIAAAAEAKAREECARIAEGHAANNAYCALPGETDGNLIGRRVAASIAGLIRTGAAS